MRTLIVSLLVVFLSPAFAQDEDARFVAVNIYVDSAGPLAAWQFELSNRNGPMKVVGVEKGDSAAYVRTPYYDREAVRLGDADRIVVADYSLAEAADLPSGRTRIATVHLMIGDESAENLTLDLIAAATHSGQTAVASISYEAETGSEQ